MTKEEKLKQFKRHLKHLEKPGATHVRLISAAMFNSRNKAECDTNTGRLVIRLGGAR